MADETQSRRASKARASALVRARAAARRLRDVAAAARRARRLAAGDAGAAGAPTQPWQPPEPGRELPRAARRLAATASACCPTPSTTYDLPALVDLALRDNPDTRSAWERRAPPPPPTARRWRRTTRPLGASAVVSPDERLLEHGPDGTLTIHQDSYLPAVGPHLHAARLRPQRPVGRAGAPAAARRQLRLQPHHAGRRLRRAARLLPARRARSRCSAPPSRTSSWRAPCSRPPTRASASAWRPGPSCCSPSRSRRAPSTSSRTPRWR